MDLRDTFGGRSQYTCALHLKNQQQITDLYNINVSDALAGPNTGHHKQHQKLQNEPHAAWERSGGEKKTGVTLHGNAFAIWMVQMGPPKKASLKQPKPRILNCFEHFLEPI